MWPLIWDFERLGDWILCCTEKGHDMGDDGSGEMTLADRMDELSTDDMLMEGNYSSPSSERFEKIIGAIEDIVVGE